jgi:pimeloyl-ACP methyl ester carboxylesterase
LAEDHYFQGAEGKFHYLDWGGDGQLLHIAHATGYCAGVYTPLAQRLTPDLRVVGLDDRGHGQTTVPADPRKLKNWNVFRDDLAAFFRSLDGPVIALGHSRGGTASLLAAAAYPELVRALILIDPTILPFSWMWWWYLAKKVGLARFVPIAYRAAKRRRIWPDRESILQSYRGKASMKRWAMAFLEAYVREGTRETADGQITWRCDPVWESRCFATCPHDLWRFVPQVRCPTLVIYGLDSDTFLKPAAERFKKVFPTAELVGLEDTSHFVPMERPEETAAAIFEFLKHNRIIAD